MNIIEKIESNINNYKFNDDWKTFNYSLSHKFIRSIQGIVDINSNDYNIRINQAIILFQCKIKINIISKKLIFKNKEICLSNYDNLYNELQHLELIIKFNKDS